MYSGTITINNEAADENYNVYGFYVPTGEKLKNLSTKENLITIQPDFAVDYTVRKLFFSDNNLNNSFSRFGQYSDASVATNAFNNLTSFSVSQWLELGDSIKANQIWLYKTGEEKYAKIRIIGTFTEKRSGMPFPYAECTFEWVYQPDGTQTFPGK